MTRTPLETLALALVDSMLGTGALILALDHGTRRGIWAQFVVYVAIILFFKARDAARRLPALVAQARAHDDLPPFGPWWLRVMRLVIGYDTWSRTEGLGIVVISAVICVLFGWDNGGPFAAALFLAIATVDAVLAIVALVARRLPA